MFVMVSTAVHVLLVVFPCSTVMVRQGIKGVVTLGQERDYVGEREM